jgi:hypothetical protein
MTNGTSILTPLGDGYQGHQQRDVLKPYAALLETNYPDSLQLQRLFVLIVLTDSIHPDPLVESISLGIV